MRGILQLWNCCIQTNKGDVTCKKLDVFYAKAEVRHRHICYNVDSSVCLLCNHSPNRSTYSYDFISVWSTRNIRSSSVVTLNRPHATSSLQIKSLQSGPVMAVLKQPTSHRCCKKHDLDTTDVKSYRPISSLSVLSKLLERLVARQLLDSFLQ